MHINEKQAVVIRNLRDKGGIDIQLVDGKWYEIRAVELTPDSFQQAADNLLKEYRNERTAD